jgi:hypothetical protein
MLSKVVIVLSFLFIWSGQLMAVTGDTVLSINAPSQCSQGLAFDGKFLWNADRKSDLIYRVDPENGAILDSLPAPGYVIRGLTWDGTLLWCVDGADEQIYAINPETRIVEKIIYCPVSRPGDLAYDGEALWIADDGANKLHRLSTEDGTITATIEAPTKYPGGLTFDGRYLWVADRISDEIYMVEPDYGDVINIFEAPGPHAWGLAWDGNYLWNVDYQDDRIYKLIVDDGNKFNRTEEKVEQVEFIFEIRNYGPDLVKTLDAYLAVPHNRDNQELLGDVVFDPEPAEYIHDKWGQKVAHFKYTDLKATEFHTITMTARAKLYQNRYFVFPDKLGTLENIPKDIKEKYLVDDSKFDINNDIIQNAVKSAIGDETNPYWMARKIFNYVIDKLEYELAGGWEVAPIVLDRGTGSCSEYTFSHIAMCRAAGIPARYVGSIVVRGDDASWDETFHRWVEVYLPGFGWLPVDPNAGDDELPRDKALGFGFLKNRFLITTVGGGGSEYLEWGYNANTHMTTVGRAKVEIEYFGEWTPLVIDKDQSE